MDIIKKKKKKVECEATIENGFPIVEPEKLQEHREKLQEHREKLQELQKRGGGFKATFPRTFPGGEATSRVESFPGSAYESRFRVGRVESFPGSEYGKVTPGILNAIFESSIYMLHDFKLVFELDIKTYAKDSRGAQFSVSVNEIIPLLRKHAPLLQKILAKYVINVHYCFSILFFSILLYSLLSDSYYIHY